MPVSVHWSEIAKAVAYKRDLIASDLICICFTTKAGVSIELNERMIGWQELIDGLPAYLGGAKRREEWWDEVALPAFKTNERVIYEKGP